MLDVRSRTGVIAVTTGAALLLALPVVAAGQVPDVGEVVGGVKGKVEGAAPAPPVPAPPVNLPARPAPTPPAPKAQGSPPARGPAAQAPAASPQAPPAHARSKKPANPGGGRGEHGPAPSPSQNEPAAGQGGGSGDGGSKAGGGDGGAGDGGGDGGKTVNTSQDDGGAPTDVEIADQVVEAPVDANPSTLPFTGLQLALLVALGLAALGTGFALRRGARSTG